MQLTLQGSGSALTIQGYDATGLVVDGERFEHSIAFSPDGPVQEWPVRDVKQLNAADAEPILAMDPEVVILATGEQTVMPPPEFLKQFGPRGIGLEAMNLGAACRTYSVLAGDERRVVAAVIISHSDP